LREKFWAKWSPELRGNASNITQLLQSVNYDFVGNKSYRYIAEKKKHFFITLSLCIDFGGVKNKGEVVCILYMKFYPFAKH
jgi:hypothetical protein